MSARHAPPTDTLGGGFSEQMAQLRTRRSDEAMQETIKEPRTLRVMKRPRKRSTPVRVIAEGHERPGDDLGVHSPLRVLVLAEAGVGVVDHEARRHAALLHRPRGGDVPAPEAPAGLPGHLVLQLGGRDHQGLDLQPLAAELDLEGLAAARGAPDAQDERAPPSEPLCAQVVLCDEQRCRRFVADGWSSDKCWRYGGVKNLALVLRCFAQEL